MSSTPVAAPNAAVHGDLEFLLPGTERPFEYGYEPGPEAPPASTAFELRRILIANVRVRAALSLEKNGATLLRCPTSVRKFYDDDELRGRYYPESAEIIRAALGASRVVVFDHNVRRGSRLAMAPARHNQGRPVYRAHTDFTDRSAPRRLNDELGAAGQQLARGRYLQVNLWRPIRGPLRDAPLAICDGSSVDMPDLRAAELRYPDRRGEISYLAYRPEQRWYYAPDMGADEAWLFKNFDSAPSGAARAAPHSAFMDSARDLPVLPRESIELRAFAFLND